MKKLHSIIVAVSISLAMALTLPSCSGGGGDSGCSEKSLLLNFTSLKVYNTTTPLVAAVNVNNSQTTDNAYPPYSLAIVRYNDPD